MSNKLNVYLPEKRRNNMEVKIKDFLDYLANEPELESFTAMPDLCDDGLILSGIYLQSRDFFYPFSPGTDLGCGYRVFHIPVQAKELVFDQMDIMNLSNLLTKKELFETDKKLLSLFLKNEINELDAFFKEKGIRTRFYDNYKKQTVSLVPDNCYGDAWGTIAPGNHFLEFREVGEIYNKELASQLSLKSGEVIGHLHSGAGKKVEEVFENYWLLFLREFQKNHQLSSDTNGYQIKFPIQHELSEQFFYDSLKSMNFSAFNRSFILLKLKKWLNAPINDWFDIFHDGLEIEGDSIQSYKGIQRYSCVKGEEIAIIPGSIEDVSYLVKRKSDITLINHGTGEGVDGKEPSHKHVLTNLENPITRKFHDIKETIDYCEKMGLIEKIAELKPWISIKNGG